jgi:hypothetical protein
MKEMGIPEGAVQFDAKIVGLGEIDSSDFNREQGDQQQMPEVNIEVEEDLMGDLEKINLENPILKSTVEDNPKDRASLFYKGTKVLSQQLVYLNHILNQTKEIKLDYNPILEKASFPSLVSKSSTIFTGIGFILGLLFSFIVIFLRHVLQNKVS